MDELEKVSGLARRRADEMEYAVEEAEDRDLTVLVENSCMHCGRQFGKGETKVLPSSYVQERDPYVSNGIVRKRYMCLGCYSLMRSQTRTKTRYKAPGPARKGLIRMIVGR